MDLLAASSKNFLEAGFDHTLVSRWRSGKRRLMPGRHQVKAIVQMFLKKNEDLEMPVLEKLLRIWYPSSTCHTQEEKQALLERFLTEKKQLTPEYQKLREVRLTQLQHIGKGATSGPRGIEAVRLGLLDFLDLISALPEPQQLCLVFTEGQYVYLADEPFGNLFMEKLMQLFRAGHRMSAAIRSDRIMTDITMYFQKIKLYAHLKGYISTKYYSGFWSPVSEKMLGVAGDSLAFQVVREDLWDFDHTYIDIYNDPQSVADVGRRMEEYLNCSHPLMRYGFFSDPGGYLSNVHIHHDRPCYIIARLPHFGIAAPDEFATLFALTEDEFDRLQRDFSPILLDPAYFDEDVPIRHIFCETEITHALKKQRHQSHELSAMLGRKIWMLTPNLVRQLKNIQSLLKTRKNYEVCFLSEKHFNEILLQIGVWGNEAVIGWLKKEASGACKEYPVVAGMQNFCISTWADIPPDMRSRTAAKHKLAQWLYP
jgi:hypothetical protein